jgi:hypothetical protein
LVLKWFFEATYKPAVEICYDSQSEKKVIEARAQTMTCIKNRLQVLSLYHDMNASVVANSAIGFDCSAQLS